MKHITFYLDFLSPYTWLAFERLPQALQGLSYSVSYQPVLLGALLQHHGQRGPAEMPHKREWTYRQVLWLAQELGVPLQMPAAHPFNPLGLLRLAWACARQGAPNRYVCEALFRHVWAADGAAADDPRRLTELATRLAPAEEPNGDAAKQQLRQATEAALGAGVFGVPSFVVDGRLFWGLDGLPLLRAHLAGDAGLEALWQAGASVAQGRGREIGGRGPAA